MKRSRGSSKSDKDSIQEEGMDSDAEVSFTGKVKRTEQAFWQMVNQQEQHKEPGIIGFVSR